MARMAVDVWWKRLRGKVRAVAAWAMEGMGREKEEWYVRSKGTPKGATADTGEEGTEAEEQQLARDWEEAEAEAAMEAGMDAEAEIEAELEAEREQQEGGEVGHDRDTDAWGTRLRERPQARQQTMVGEPKPTANRKRVQPA